MNSVIFEHDNNCEIKIDNSKCSEKFTRGSKCEQNFRVIHTYLILKGIIKNNIIDLGAYVGDNSIPWATMTKNTIYAIDPSSENCEYIEKISKNNNISNIKVINKAISDKKEILTTSNNLDHCSFVWDGGFVGKVKNYDGKHKINAESLDNLYKDGVLENIGYIHLDVEGMEHKILQGSVLLIKTFSPIITFEGHINHEKDEVAKNISFLKEREYTIYMIKDIIFPNQCWGDCRNFIAFPKNVDFEKIVQDINILKKNCLEKVII